MQPYPFCFLIIKWEVFSSHAPNIVCCLIRNLTGAQNNRVPDLGLELLRLWVKINLSQLINWGVSLCRHKPWWRARVQGMAIMLARQIRGLWVWLLEPTLKKQDMGLLIIPGLGDRDRWIPRGTLAAKLDNMVSFRPVKNPVLKKKVNNFYEAIAVAICHCPNPHARKHTYISKKKATSTHTG